MQFSNGVPEQTTRSIGGKPTTVMPLGWAQCKSSGPASLHWQPCGAARSTREVTPVVASASYAAAIATYSCSRQKTLGVLTGVPQLEERLRAKVVSSMERALDFISRDRYHKSSKVLDFTAMLDSQGRLWAKLLIKSRQNSYKQKRNTAKQYVCLFFGRELMLFS